MELILTLAPVSAPHLSAPILIVLHQEHSTPGRVGRLLRERGFALDIRRPPLGEPLPKDLRDHHAMIVFGGPQSANDPEPWIAAETDLLGRASADGGRVLGLCLGAQMLIRAYGGTVATHPEGRAEIGYYAVKPTPAGAQWASEQGNPWPSTVYQWHREGWFDLPKGFEALVEGDDFQHQAFRLGDKAYGLQFHPEVTYAMMCRWTVRAHERMQTPGARPRHEHLSGWFEYDPAVRRWLDGFLDLWAGHSGGTTAPQSHR